MLAGLLACPVVSAFPSVPIQSEQTVAKGGNNPINGLTVAGTAPDLHRNSLFSGSEESH